MTEVFYKLLINGLLICGGLVTMIISIVLWRKMLVDGKSFTELGSEGNGLVFMGVLSTTCFFLAWRVKRAKKKIQ